MFSKVLIVTFLLFGLLTNEVEALFGKKPAKQTKVVAPTYISPVIVES